jgi:hypothetical protein|tara:strand:+ start:1308 stop:1760 length:453 start_codon:yes stop_codon:yes gene_type:complete
MLRRHYSATVEDETVYVWTEGQSSVCGRCLKASWSGLIAEHRAADLERYQPDAGPSDYLPYCEDCGHVDAEAELTAEGMRYIYGRLRTDLRYARRMERQAERAHRQHFRLKGTASTVAECLQAEAKCARADVATAAEVLRSHGGTGGLYG